MQAIRCRAPSAPFARSTQQIPISHPRTTLPTSFASASLRHPNTNKLQQANGVTKFQPVLLSRHTTFPLVLPRFGKRSSSSSSSSSTGAVAPTLTLPSSTTLPTTDNSSVASISTLLALIAVALLGLTNMDTKSPRDEEEQQQPQMAPLTDLSSPQQDELPVVLGRLFGELLRVVNIQPSARPVLSLQAISFAANEPIEDRLTWGYEQSGTGVYAAIFDGHGGTAAAEFCKENMLRFVSKEVDAFKKQWQRKHPAPTLLHPAVPAKNSSSNNNTPIYVNLDDQDQLTEYTKGVKDAMKRGFQNADEAFLTACAKGGQKGFESGASGACAMVVYVDSASNLVFTANAGDSRAILSGIDENGLWSVEALSSDHTPTNPRETKRLQQEHPGEPDVVKRGRVKGSLQPSRGVGDGVYKLEVFNSVLNRKPANNWFPPYTTANPDVTVNEILPEHKMIIMATDGLWDNFTSEDVVARAGRYWFLGGQTLAAELMCDSMEKVLTRERITTAEGLQQFMDQPAKIRRSHYDDTSIIVMLLQQPARAIPENSEVVARRAELLSKVSDPVGYVDPPRSEERHKKRQQEQHQRRRQMHE